MSLRMDKNFMENLLSATGWTSNPPKITKSLVSTLPTILEDEVNSTAQGATNKCDLKVDSDPEHILDLELEEGWAKGPCSTETELVTDFQGGAGDNLDEDRHVNRPPTFTRCCNCELPSSRNGLSSRGTPSEPVMMVSQSTGPEKPRIAIYDDGRPRDENKSAITSPEFMLYTPAASPFVAKRSVRLQTSENPVLASRGKRMIVLAREINTGHRKNERTDAVGTSIEMIDRPEDYIIPPWTHRKVMRCRARNINSGRAGSRVEATWPSISILDEAIYVNEEQEFIGRPRDISAYLFPHPPHRLSETLSTATCLEDGIEVPSGKTMITQVTNINVEQLAFHLGADTIKATAHTVSVGTSPGAEYENPSEKTLGSGQRPLDTNLNDSSTSKYNTAAQEAIGISSNPETESICQITAGKTKITKGRDTNLDLLDSHLSEYDEADAPLKAQKTTDRDFSPNAMLTSSLSELARMSQASAQTKAEEPQTTTVIKSAPIVEHFNNSSEASELSAEEANPIANNSQRQREQTAVLAGPFHIPHPPPLPPQSSTNMKSQRSAQRRTESQETSRRDRKIDDNSLTELQTAHTSFIELDQPHGGNTQKRHSNRQASILLSPTDDEQELVVSRIRLVPHVRSRRRVVPPIGKTSDASAGRIAPKLTPGERLSLITVHRAKSPSCGQRSVQQFTDPPNLRGPQTAARGLRLPLGSRQSLEQKLTTEQGSTTVRHGVSSYVVLTLGQVPKHSLGTAAYSSNVGSPIKQSSGQPQVSKCLISPAKNGAHHQSQTSVRSPWSVPTEILAPKPQTNPNFPAASGPHMPVGKAQPSGHASRHPTGRFEPSADGAHVSVLTAPVAPSPPSRPKPMFLSQVASRRQVSRLPSNTGFMPNERQHKTSAIKGDTLPPWERTKGFVSNPPAARETQRLGAHSRYQLSVTTTASRENYLMRRCRATNQNQYKYKNIVKYYK